MSGTAELKTKYDRVLDMFIDVFRDLLKTEKKIRMENQHRKIKGYRELNQDEIDLMNQIKKQGIAIGRLVDALQNLDSTDKRWLAIGRTDMQKGLMALTRAVAKPDFF